MCRKPSFGFIPIPLLAAERTLGNWHTSNLHMPQKREHIPNFPNFTREKNEIHRLVAQV